MKTLSSIIAATLLIASVGASAGSIQQVNTSKTIETSAASTRAAAYEQGVNKLASLQTLSARQLDLALVNGGNVIVDTLHLNDGSNVTIQERVNANGEKDFIGMINVAFGYAEKTNDN